VAGATVNDFSIEAEPKSGGKGTQVTLRGAGCILDGTPLEEAHVGSGFRHPPGVILLDLVAQIGPDGTWTTSFTVPPNVTQGGPMQFEASCEAPGTRIRAGWASARNSSALISEIGRLEASGTG
jgi:hypothetical protein